MKKPKEVQDFQHENIKNQEYMRHPTFKFDENDAEMRRFLL